MECPNCGGALTTPSMMDGTMRCHGCMCIWNAEWLSKLGWTLASCRRALTRHAYSGIALEGLLTKMLAKIESLQGYCGHEWRERMAEVARHSERAWAFDKAARTSMDRCQGRGK